MENSLGTLKIHTAIQNGFLSQHLSFQWMSTLSQLDFHRTSTSMRITQDFTATAQIFASLQKKNGYDCIVIDAPVVHLSGGKIDSNFAMSSEWLLNKWGKSMNNIIPTCANIIYKPNVQNFFTRARIRLNCRFSTNPSRSKCNCDQIVYSEI